MVNKRPPTWGAFVLLWLHMEVVTLFLFLLGVCIGSFINVIVLRFEKGEKITGRSHCPHCLRTLHAYELVPLFSYLFLRGKCKSCKVPLSVQYPLVELITGVLFALVPLIGTEPLDITILLGALSVLVAIVVYDMRHKIIPDSFVYTFNVLALASVFVEGGSIITNPDPLLLLSGALASFPFALLWVVSKGAWIGFADAKLALGMGWFLGIMGALSAFMLAFWIGAVISLLLLLIKHNRFQFMRNSLTIHSEVPFAPFLALGFLLVLFFSINAFTLPTQLFY